MVSSDFGKLEARRHLISGIDCAMAGEATAATAAPAVDTFKNSRRFMWPLLVAGVSQKFPGACSTMKRKSLRPRTLRWALSNTDTQPLKMRRLDSRDRLNESSMRHVRCCAALQCRQAAIAPLS